MRRIELRVITRAKKEEIQKISEDSYRIKVLLPPERGKANKKKVELLSKEFGVKKHAVRVVSGNSSNRKVVEIVNG